MPRIAAGLVLCLLAFGCSLDQASDKPLTASELNTNAARYNGRTVTMRGLVQLGPQSHLLYESKAMDAKFQKGWNSDNPDFDVRTYFKYCLTIANPDLLLENKVTLNNKTLTVKGKFIDDYLHGEIIDFGACPLPTAIILDLDDFKRRYGSLLTTP